MATVCTKLFNAVEVGHIYIAPACQTSYPFFAARPRVLWPERYTTSSFIKDSYVLIKSLLRRMDLTKNNKQSSKTYFYRTPPLPTSTSYPPHDLPLASRSLPATRISPSLNSLSLPSFTRLYKWVLKPLRAMIRPPQP